MKQLYIKLLLFFAPILVLIFIAPIQRRQKYLGLKDDCLNRAEWVHDRIFENKESIDLAFLGSSHTINGVDDNLIEQEISKATGYSVVNFGYCRLGRNFTYILTKELLEAKELKSLIIEVREDEDRYSHPMFPYLGRTSDVLSPAILFNRDIAVDYLDHFSYKVELIQDQVLGTMVESALDTRSHGHNTNPDTADVNILREKKERLEARVDNMGESERDFYMSFARTYLEQIAALCRENEVELHFIYLPAFGSNLREPKELDTYAQYGEVWIPPSSIFQDTDNWYDPNHLNVSGSKLLSKWIAGEIAAKRIDPK